MMEEEADLALVSSEPSHTFSLLSFVSVSFESGMDTLAGTRCKVL